MCLVYHFEGRLKPVLDHHHHHHTVGLVSAYTMNSGHYSVRQ